MSLPRTPALATDCVVFDPLGRVLLIRRAHEPRTGKYALPGGFVKLGETVDSACRREVMEETGIEITEINLVGVYSDIDRDPRGHIVSVAFKAELMKEIMPRAGRTRKAPTGSKHTTLNSNMTTPEFCLMLRSLGQTRPLKCNPEVMLLTIPDYVGDLDEANCLVAHRALASRPTFSLSNNALWVLTLPGAHHGDDIGLHHAIDLGDPVQDRFVAIGGVLAIELGHELLVRKHNDIGEFAVFHLQRLEHIDRLAGIGRAEQLDKKIDVHHVKQASTGCRLTTCHNYARVKLWLCVDFGSSADISERIGNVGLVP